MSELEITLPLTKRQPDPARAMRAFSVWSQAEYCEAIAQGYRFTAHGRLWNYLIGTRIIVLQMQVIGDGSEVLVDQEVKQPFDWIEEARIAAGKVRRERGYE